MHSLEIRRLDWCIVCFPNPDPVLSVLQDNLIPAAWQLRRLRPRCMDDHYNPEPDYPNDLVEGG